MVALGERVAGLMASDDEAADHVLDAAESAGEAFWRLPIPDGTRKKLDSKVADIRSGGNRYGGALTAAAFLHRLVPAQTPWRRTWTSPALRSTTRPLRLRPPMTAPASRCAPWWRSRSPCRTEPVRTDVVDGAGAAGLLAAVAARRPGS